MAKTPPSAPYHGTGGILRCAHLKYSWLPERNLGIQHFICEADASRGSGFEMCGSDDMPRCSPPVLETGVALVQMGISESTAICDF